MMLKHNQFMLDLKNVIIKTLYFEIYFFSELFCLPLFTSSTMVAAGKALEFPFSAK